MYDGGPRRLSYVEWKSGIMESLNEVEGDRRWLGLQENEVVDRRGWRRIVVGDTGLHVYNYIMQCLFYKQHF